MPKQFLGTFYGKTQNYRAKDYTNALKWYSEAIQQNNPQAMTGKAVMLEYGLGTDKNYNEAATLYQEAMNLGYSEAICRLGELKYNKLGHYYEAINLFRRASEMGHDKAKFNLAVSYLSGVGVEKNIYEAERLLKSLSDKGYAKAQAELGWMYYYYNSTNRDKIQQCVELINQSVEKNDEIGKFRMALLYSKGIGVTKDYEKAFNLFKESSSQGYIQAYNYLGLMYEHGRGTEKNLKEAITCYSKSANMDNINGYCHLAMMYLSGRSVDKDYSKAFDLFRKASDAGHFWGKIFLSYMYYYGLGTNVDKKFSKTILNYCCPIKNADTTL